MFFTHVMAGRRDSRPYEWADVVIDVDPRTKARIIFRIRRSYRAMRRGGMSEYEARGFLWDLVSTGIHNARQADHDVWRAA